MSTVLSNEKKVFSYLFLKRSIFFRTIGLELKWPTLKDALALFNITAMALVGLLQSAKNALTTVPSNGEVKS